MLFSPSIVKTKALSVFSVLTSVAFQTHLFISLIAMYVHSCIYYFLKIIPKHVKSISGGLACSVLRSGFCCLLDWPGQHQYQHHHIPHRHCPHHGVAQIPISTFSHMGQFLQDGKNDQTLSRKNIFCRFTVTKRCDFFNFSQLFWRDFVLYILKIVLFWS